MSSMGIRPLYSIYDIIAEDEEEDAEHSSRRGSTTTPLQREGMELENIPIERISEASQLELIDFSAMVGIQDDARLEDLEDIRERLVLIKMQQMGCSHKRKVDKFFTSVQAEAKVKVDALSDLMKHVKEIFQKIPTESLSEVLFKEGHLHDANLMDELSERIRMLEERNSTIIIAGETNGGKSSFINLLLGENILPTDVLHCTYTICKIMYSDTFRVCTIDYRGTVEEIVCASAEEARGVLRTRAAKEGVFNRLQGSVIKECIVYLPSPILKSGVTLVDTPGIGEDDNMDEVTISYVRSTQASAFIYIIKSDTAGGVQEDRLLSFLRAIKERYQTESMREFFDPRAAMFVCHRWDQIDESQREKVQKNALQRLEDVWPGFSSSQTFFFSTKQTQKHLPVDPEFITDSYFELLGGLKSLFDRAGSNAIKYQYFWLKYILQPASRHLKSMITYCIRSNEELENNFHNVVVKQQTLMESSEKNAKIIEDELNREIEGLKSMIHNVLNIGSGRAIDGWDELLAECSQENFLSIQDNRLKLDDSIISWMLKYVNSVVNEDGILGRIETNVLHSIEQHLGLFKSQIKQIKHQMENGENLAASARSKEPSFDQPDSFGRSFSSMASESFMDSEIEHFQGEITLNISQLANTVKYLLSKRRQGRVKYNGSFNTKQEVSRSLLTRIFEKIQFTGKINSSNYLENRVEKIARKIREDAGIIDNIVAGQTEWIKRCVSLATNSVPKFIAVNTTLMEEIREHRDHLQNDKDKLKQVMLELEPSRDHLKGFGSLYMEDINADMVDFMPPDRRVNSVVIPSDLWVSVRPNDDSGFQGSGSKHRKVRSLWGRMQLATITVDKETERVIIKTYTYELDVKDFFSEIASLRCLEHENIAQFFGMTRIRTAETGGATFGIANPQLLGEDKVPAFIFRGELVSTKVYTSNKFVRMQDFIPAFVASLLKALEYIHREKLVHMELNTDTVMIEKATGIVKLCQMCKPREARFPRDLSLVKTGSCVYLSPSVLAGSVYEQTDDIYAFGLLLWELLFPGKQPYKSQRELLLKDFIETCHPKDMLHAEMVSLKPSESVTEVLTGTLFTKRNSVCMSIVDVQRYLRDLDKDPAVVHYSRVKYQAVRYNLNREDSSNGQSNGHTDTTASLNMSPPVRPPRKNDYHRKISVGAQPSGQHQQSVNPDKNKGRRQSEPVISPDYHYEKAKTHKPFHNIIPKLKKIMSSRKSEAEHRNGSEFSQAVLGRVDLNPQSVDHPGVMRRYSAHLDTQALPSGSPFSLRKLSMAPSSTGKINQPRRYSLQDMSLTVPKFKNDGQSTTNLDVPQIMSMDNSRYETPLSRTTPRSGSPASHMSTNSFGTLTPAESVPCLTPSVEERRNNFFPTDDKIIDSWHSPVMARKTSAFSQGNAAPGLASSSRRSSLNAIKTIFKSSNPKGGDVRNLKDSMPLDEGMQFFERIQEELGNSTKSNGSVKLPYKPYSWEEDDTCPIGRKSVELGASFRRKSLTSENSFHVDRKLNSSPKTDLGHENGYSHKGSQGGFSAHPGILLSNSSLSKSKRSVSFDNSVRPSWGSDYLGGSNTSFPFSTNNLKPPDTSSIMNFSDDESCNGPPTPKQILKPIELGESVSQWHNSTTSFMSSNNESGISSAAGSRGSFSMPDTSSIVAYSDSSEAESSDDQLATEQEVGHTFSDSVLGGSVSQWNNPFDDGQGYSTNVRDASHWDTHEENNVKSVSFPTPAPFPINLASLKFDFSSATDADDPFENS